MNALVTVLSEAFSCEFQIWKLCTFSFGCHLSFCIIVEIKCSTDLGDLRDVLIVIIEMLLVSLGPTL